MQPLIVSCPQCGKKSIWNSANPFRPFCCQRCKMIDLGQWANETYRVAQHETEFTGGLPPGEPLA